MKNRKVNTLVLVLGVTIGMSSIGFSQERGDRKTPPTFSELLKNFDADADGKLVKGEVEEPLKSQFEKIDTDEDGFITEEEFKNAPKPEQAKKESKSQKGSKGGKAPLFSELIEQMDANKDGKLAKSEVKGPLKNDFSKVDTDEDGFISEAEFENAPKPERQERPRR
ncbi:EF-hand domain-containing protein [Algibacter miyuki]|uniref:EF-hand domain-containing protein n=1 Tax=Algibacter miyuki TaxID=1306933 RepID=A0ABV5H250_9FLAO|nr:EF-hand domain-containing protein [Algibacter miyuki]MDN3666586.1 hypothetical protein [Algibacter miyuki]